ncbi:hypothetical protein TNCV_1863091 [Trichonephila clavipes]|nr:hypothetical protein TNCV_1863091 [Trichonephila clavipes]
MAAASSSLVSSPEQNATKRGRFDAVDLLLDLHAIGPQSIGFLLDPPKIETPVVTEECLIARVIFVSADITKTPNLFERVRQSFTRRYWITYDLHDYHFERFPG